MFLPGMALDSWFSLGPLSDKIRDLVITKAYTKYLSGSIRFHRCLPQRAGGKKRTLLRNASSSEKELGIFRNKKVLKQDTQSAVSAAS